MLIEVSDQQSFRHCKGSFTWNLSCVHPRPAYLRQRVITLINQNGFNLIRARYKDMVPEREREREGMNRSITKVN